METPHWRNDSQPLIKGPPFAAGDAPHTMHIFDAHCHIIDPRFPLVANQDYLPDPFTVADYRRRMGDVAIAGGAVVSGSFQAYDQSYLIDALQSLGKGFVGVTQLPESVTDEEIRNLHETGVRALRFNLKRRGAIDLNQIDRMARRVYNMAGWHAEFYVEAKHLADLGPTLRNLPKRSIDHLGLTKEGFTDLLKLVEAGVKVKATGFSRADFDVTTAMRAIHDIDPTALMFGTDLPSTRAPKPYTHADLELVQDTFDQTDTLKVLRENAQAFYGILTPRNAA